jgi:hypothetical protein
MKTHIVLEIVEAVLLAIVCAEAGWSPFRTMVFLVGFRMLMNVRSTINWRGYAKKYEAVEAKWSELSNFLNSQY